MLRDKRIAVRFDTNSIEVHKPWSDSVVMCRKYLSAIAYSANGNNADGEALMWAYQDIMKRHESRKIIIVFSDGKPAVTTTHGYGEQYLSEVVRTIGKTRVELLGIGIMSDDVEEYYPKYVVTRNLNEFAEKGVSAVASILTRKQMDLSRANG
jgi:cobalamin biosynthesis protein CobT